MRVYRLAPSAFADLSGEGAKLFPGRWNSAGLPCLYTSASAALALLETMVNAEDWTVFDRVAYKLMTIEVSEDVLVRVKTKDLPRSWNSQAVQEGTREFGARFLADLKVVGIVVPSVVMPAEFNVVLNPRAINFQKQVKMIRSERFTLDQRFLK